MVPDRGVRHRFHRLCHYSANVTAVDHPHLGRQRDEVVARVLTGVRHGYGTRSRCETQVSQICHYLGRQRDAVVAGVLHRDDQLHQRRAARAADWGKRPEQISGVDGED
jgi:hypothetical protein